MRHSGCGLEGPPEERREARRRRARLLDIFAEGHYYTNELAASEAPYRESLQIVRDLAKEEPHSLTRCGCSCAVSGRSARSCSRSAPSAPARPSASGGLTGPRRRRFACSSLRTKRRSERVGDGVDLCAGARGARPGGRGGSHAERRGADAPRSLEGIAGKLGRRAGLRHFGLGAGRHADQGARALARLRELRHAVDMLERMRKAGRLAKLDEETTLQPIQEKVAQYCEGKSASAG